MHVILVHGWKASPETAWFPWLQKSLINSGYTVDALTLPRAYTPDRWSWVRFLQETFKEVDPTQTIIIAHSLGCPSVLFALEKHVGPAFRKVILVSGFCRPFFVPFIHTWFFGARPNMNIVRDKAKEWSVIHGDKDPLVPYKEGMYLAKSLGVSLRTLNGRGHFTPQEDCYELPEVLEELPSSSI